MSDHARFAPSSMDANLQCTARVPFIESFPVVEGAGDGGNIYTYEGTVAHAIAEQVLTAWWVSDDAEDIGQLLSMTHRSPWSGWCDGLPDAFSAERVDQDMLDYIQTYIEQVQAILQQCKDPELYVEKRVTVVEDQCYGTADVIIVDTHDLYVIDLKFGAGVAVSAVENKQALTYLAGAALGYRDDVPQPELYHSIIIQPRIASAEPYSEWVVTEDVITEHGLDIAKMLTAVAEEKTSFKEGSHCRWCPVKAVCPQLEKVARGMDMEQPPDRMTNDALAEALEWAKKAEFYISALREYAHKGIENANFVIPGWKVVDKRATTKWKDEHDAFVWLEQHDINDSEATKKTILTPTQMGKLLTKENREKMLDELTVKKSSGTVLVAESDRRESVVENESKGQAKARQLRAVALSK